MATEENKGVITGEEAYAAGYFGVVTSKVPNEFHEAGSEEMRNAVYGALPENFSAKAADGPFVVDASKLGAVLVPDLSNSVVNAPEASPAGKDAPKAPDAK